MNTLALTKKLVSIPSYFNDDCNEKEIADFIYDYLKTNTNLFIKKDFVAQNRFNIIAYSKSCFLNNKFEISTLFIDHIDTVEPKQGNRHGIFSGVEDNGQLYGLGSCDSKANVAVLMKLAENVKDQKIMFLFYVDEEYDFKGIYAFIKKYKNLMKVNEIISLDGEDLKIRNACRGLVEFKIVCRGKTGHSANPKNGASAITGFLNAIGNCNKYLKRDNGSRLGQNSMNISYIKGGLYLGNRFEEILLGKNGNNIADYIEATIELRTNNKFNLNSFLKKFRTLLTIQNLKTEEILLRFNLKPWLTNKNYLEKISQSLRKNKIKLEFTEPSTSGYVDIALLNEEFNSKCFCIGVKGKNRHGLDELVDIKSIFTLEKILADLIN